MATSQNGGDSDPQKPAKRLKTDANDTGNDGEPAAERSISGFEVGRILRDSTREKNIFAHGKVRSENSRESHSVSLLANVTLGLHLKRLFAAFISALRSVCSNGFYALYSALCV